MTDRNKFKLDLAVECAMARAGLPRNKPSLRAAVRKKLLKEMENRPLLRDQYAAEIANAKKATRRRGARANGG